MAQPEVRKGSGSPPEGPGEIERLTQKTRRSREAHSEVREGSGGPLGGAGGVGRPTRR